MQRNQLIDTIVQLIFKLSGELMAIEGANPNDLWPLLPGRQATEPFKTAKQTVDEIVAIVKHQNANMLSDHVILAKLVYGAAAIRLQIRISDQELEDRARRGAADLIDYKAFRDVDVPILLLELGNNPFIFGPVTFHPISPEDKMTDWWKMVTYTLGDSIDTLVLSYARVNAPGDLHKSVDNAAAIITEALLLLRGIGFPLTVKEKCQFGILNEYPLWQNVPYRLGYPKETTRVDAQSDIVTTTGPFHIPYNLHKEILSDITQERLQTLLSLVTQTGFSPKNSMDARLLYGLRWLGEASRPDALPARFAKVAFSLENLVGGDPKDDLLTTRGITATLAERAAFLVSEEFDTRMKIDRDVRKFYEMRSAIAHGRVTAVQPFDFEEFGLLVRQIAFSLIERRGQFNSIDDLQRWVTTQRYSTNLSNTTR